MSKAFDKVWHDGLIFKLKQNGVEGKFLDLLKNYLNNRYQRVTLNGNSSDWGPIKSGVPQGSVLGPLLFLVYINDLEHGIKSKVKFFADDTSLFSIVRDPKISANELNHDLALINQWAWKWKMSFTPDPTKPAQEVLFSHKNNSPIHPPLYFNGRQVKRVTQHKHLGLILDSKLTFADHLSSKLANARKGIGVIKHLAPYLPLKSRDQIFKMHIRPHLDYCDFIYHIPTKISETNLLDTTQSMNYLMKNLERTQYQAALAVSGAWKGTSRTKIYDELGWESLEDRRTYRRILQFYKIIKGLTPGYLREPIPPIRNHLFGNRQTNVIQNIYCRNDRFSRSFFPNSIIIWKELGPEFRGSESLSLFKIRLLKIYRPIKKDMFDIDDYEGVKRLYQLRVGLSPLKNHKKSHNFIDTPNDICDCTHNSETTQHYLLHCINYINQRRDLSHTLNPLFEANNLRYLSFLTFIFSVRY